MHLSRLFFGPFRWLVPLLCVVCCGAAAAQTTITGTVYSPYGPGVGDPIPNILVYVAQSPVLSFASTVGAGVTGGCTAQANLVSGNPLVSALTDANGKFTLTSAAIPSSANIVIQAGKWRRQYLNTSITIGGTTTLQLTMPPSQGTLPDGSVADLPHIAIVTGSVDAVECIFHQIGIADSEFTNPDGTGSINLYKGAYSGGAVITASTSSDPTPGEAALVSSSTTLANYDVVIFGCQGSPDQTLATTGPYPNPNQTNLIDFANSGGRLFATHYEYVWLDTDQPFEGTAAWRSSNEAIGTGIATIDQTYPEGATLAQWIQNVGASYNNTLGQIQLENTDVNTTAVNNPPAQSWVRLNNTTYNNPSMQFTFDTPIGSAGSPTIAISYANSTTTFLQGDTSDSITINVINNSTASADPSLNLTLALPGGLTPTSLMGVGNTGWTCDLPTLKCNRLTTGQPLAPGATDSVTLVFNIASTAPVGQASITASLAGGGISGTGQCGRVLFNDYHVENTSVKTNAIYPSECQGLPGTAAGTATAQEKFLEFSLYNLSNFIAPTTTDVILIQGPTSINWPQPAAIFYGTPLGSAQYDATAVDPISGATVAGSFAYTSPQGPFPNAGNNIPLVAVFTPTDATDYLSSTLTDYLQVNPDPTSTGLTSTAPTSTPGQSVTFNAIITDTYYSPVSGTITFYDGAAVLATVPATANAASFTTASLEIGLHNVTACFVSAKNSSGTYNFVSNTCSAPLLEIITPPATVSPTATVLVSSLNPSVVGQSVTFTATPATTGAFLSVPTGSVNFFDGTNNIGSGILSNGVATLTTTTLAAGLHQITAKYSGSTTMAPSTSAAVPQQVNSSLDSAGTGFLMTVSPTTFSNVIGGSTGVAVSILELNNFNTPVTLSCSGLPAEATCTFATPTIPATGGSTTLTVTVAAPHNCNVTTLSSLGGSTYLSVFAAVVLAFFARRRRVLKGMLLAAVLCILPAIGGCGDCTDLGVKPGTYTFTVIGSAGSSSTPPTNPTPVVVTTGTSSSPSTTTQSQAMTMTVTI